MERPTSEIDDFYALSIALTGYSLFDLRGTGVGERYLLAAQHHAGAEVERLLATYREIERDTGGLEPALGRAIRARIMADPELGPLARNILKAWYLGTWDLGGGNTPVVSAEAYQQGLAWRAAEAHPMGAKQTGWASWAVPPREDL